MDHEELIKRLRNERGVLKRALLDEKQNVTDLKTQLFDKDREVQELMVKLDQIGDEKSRMQNLVSKLKKDLASEQQASTVNLQGGSMFSSFISSADGTASEITRLQKQIRVMEEELEVQIKNTASIHSNLQDAKDNHSRERARLQQQAQQALHECETLTNQVESLNADLEYSRRERREMQTQIDAKNALVNELNQKLQSKSEALQYVEELRVSDLKALEDKFTSRVPFDDAALGEVVLLSEVQSRPMLIMAARIQCESIIVSNITKLNNWIVSRLAICRSNGVSVTQCDMLSDVSSKMVYFHKTILGWVHAKHLPGMSSRKKRAQLYQDVKDSFKMMCDSYKAMTSHYSLSGDSIPLFEAFVRCAPLVQKLSRHLLLDDGVQIDSILSVCSDLGTSFRDVDNDAASKRVAVSEIFGAMAQALHEYVMQIRLSRNDNTIRGSAREFMKRETCTKRINAAMHLETQDHETVSKMNSVVEDQKQKLAQLEKLYQEARTALTTKEKQLLQNIPNVSTTVPMSSNDTGPLVILDDSNKATLHDGLVFSDSYLVSESERKKKTLCELDNILEQMRTLESKAVSFQSSLSKEEMKNKENTDTIAKLRNELQQRDLRIGEMSKASTSDISSIRASYENQIQLLTRHMMELQDAEQEREGELRRLKHLLDESKVKTGYEDAEEEEEEEYTGGFQRSSTNPFG